MRKHPFRESMLALGHTDFGRNAKIIMAFICVMAVSFLLPSCNDNKNDEPVVDNQEVTVLLDYSLMESGSMTRSGEEVYTNFYESYIKTKKLAPKSYELEFTGINESDKTKRFIKQIKGWWGESDGVRLPSSTYKVEGSSVPKTATPGCACDSLWMAFDETITISNDTRVVTFNAKYNCFLLLFDAENTSSIETYYFDKPSEKHLLKCTDDIYYLFVNKTQRDMFDSSSRLEVKITRKSGTIIRIDLSQIPFEKGKYYYFNDVANTFDIEPMDQGN